MATRPAIATRGFSCSHCNDSRSTLARHELTTRAAARSAGWNFQVDWWKLDDTKVDREQVGSCAVKRWRRQLRYPSWRKMIAQYGYIIPALRGRLGLPADVDPSAICCSEFVAECFRCGGFDFTEADHEMPAHTPPGAIARYPCLHREGMLELDVEKAGIYESDGSIGDLKSKEASMVN